MIITDYQKNQGWWDSGTAKEENKKEPTRSASSSCRVGSRLHCPRTEEGQTITKQGVKRNENCDGPVRGRRQSTGSLPRGGKGGGWDRGAMMDMMEMMDDQDGRDLSSFFASLLLCWTGLSGCLNLFRSYSLWDHPESDSSAAQKAAGALCAVDMDLSALQL